MVAANIFYTFLQNAKAKTIEAASAPVLPGDVKPVATATILPPSATLNTADKLKQLINQAPIMLFMKGNAENPQCGI